ncbi:MAG: serine hydrolase [Actinomycetota bacterium]|nr:serine hydrolase [Actinomycetota bacterium]
MAWEELDGWLQSRADADEFSGAVLVRQRDTIPFSGAYGPASRRWPVPNTMNTRFDTASITRLCTAVAALQLVGAGRLALDSPITMSPKDGIRCSTTFGSVRVGSRTSSAIRRSVHPTAGRTQPLGIW